MHGRSRPTRSTSRPRSCIADVIRYHPAAAVDLLAEVRFLENQAPGLGRRFLAEVRRAEGLIREFPEVAEPVDGSVRKHVLQTFRYSVFYSVEDDGILVLAIAHHRRRPGYWLGRTKE